MAEVFGVRHLSPASAWHLARTIEAVRPTAVLIEGPSDADPLVPYLADAGTHPPIAILAYARGGKGRSAPGQPTHGEPVRTVTYPLAEFSPEWVAARAGIAMGAVVRFIDLPAAVLLAGGPGSAVRETLGAGDPLAALAAAAGEADHETWWEREFEHLTDGPTFRAAVEALGRELRTVESTDGARVADSARREAYMRRAIRKVLAEGHEPARVVVVCGAVHAAALVADAPAMTDGEARRLPRTEATVTLVPYTHRRMSAAEDYGAGARAPAYLQAMWEARTAADGRRDRVAAGFLAAVAARLRRAGKGRSSAEVIEAVRLARTLAALAGGSEPALRDLRDAAVTCLGDGDPRAVVAHLAAVEVGDAVGSVAVGVPRTALQEDFHGRVRELNLERYLKDVEQTIQGSSQDGWLNLRDNRYVKTAEAAGRDLQRSVFLHRLEALGVGFARRVESSAEAGQNTFKEVWVARWTPTCELRLVDEARRGDSVEIAAAERLGERLWERPAGHGPVGTDVAETIAVARQGRVCDLPAVVAAARTRLQRLAVDDTRFTVIASATRALADLVRTPDVRRLDLAPFKPLVGQLYLRATLTLQAMSRCTDEAASAVADGMAAMDAVTTYEDWGDEVVPAARWYVALQGVMDDRASHPRLAGAACALLAARGRLDDAALGQEVSRRLSAGMDPTAAAGFFEGLVSGNRDAILSRSGLWQTLADYVDGLDESDFRRTVPGLRRAFARFEPSEVRAVTDTLARLWGDLPDHVAQAVAAGVDAGELDAVAGELGDLGL